MPRSAPAPGTPKVCAIAPNPTFDVEDSDSAMNIELDLYSLVRKVIIDEVKTTPRIVQDTNGRRCRTNVTSQRMDRPDLGSFWIVL